MSLWTLLPVFLLLGVFVVLSLWLRRFAVPNRGDVQIDVVGSRRLDGQNTLYVVDVDGERYLMGTGRDGVRLLGTHRPEISSERREEEVR